VQAIRGGVRSASPVDAAACVAIYRPYVENTVISWEIDVPSVDEMASRIASAQEAHEWLVLEQDDQVIAFAYGHPLNRLPSQQWSVETGIYVSRDHHRGGRGRTLYAEVLRRLAERGYRRAFAGITQPTTQATAYTDPSGFRMPACTGESCGNTAAGTTWPGCSSICRALPTRTNRQTQSADSAGTRLAR